MANYIPGLDYTEWEALGIPVVGSSSALHISNGSWMCEDRRNNDYANPEVYYSQAAGASGNVRVFNTKLCSWMEITSSLSNTVGAFGAGVACEFIPSLSPSGTLAAGNTTTRVVLSTALPAAVVANQIANRGDGKGWYVRITGKSAGGSGKTEERRVIANTSGTTPTLELESALSFTPAAGDGYEFLSGSYVIMLTGSVSAGVFKRFDRLTGAVSSLGVAGSCPNLAATGNNFVVFDPSYVPNNRKSGEGQVVGAGTYNGGLFGCLTATASAAGTITGEASAGDFGFPANTFRNYAIRIVEDTGTPTAVGQIRRITSHTGGGVTPVYTLASNWTVTPSATAKFVIEHYGDNLMLLPGGATTTYNYVISTATWDTTTWAASPSSVRTTGAFSVLCHGVVPNTLGTYKSGIVVAIRGNSAFFDYLDISAAATGSWSSLNPVDNSTAVLDCWASTSDCVYMAYNPHTQDGKFLYFLPGATSQTTISAKNFGRLDVTNFKISKFAGPKMVGGSATPATSKSAFVMLCYNGTEKVVSYVTPRPSVASSAPDYWRCLLNF